MYGKYTVKPKLKIKGPDFCLVRITSFSAVGWKKILSVHNLGKKIDSLLSNAAGACLPISLLFVRLTLNYGEACT